jgi:hypothetical protein
MEPMKDKESTTCNKAMENVFERLGIPETIYSDFSQKTHKKHKIFKRSSDGTAWIAYDGDEGDKHILALLAAGKLQGERLSSFVNRSFDWIRKS